MSLNDDIANLVVVLPPSAVDALAQGLEVGRVSLSTSSFGFARLRGISDDHAGMIAAALQMAGTDERSVATAFRVANRLRFFERVACPEIEIAWTGPAAPGPLVRSTSVVMEEMLESDRESREVLQLGHTLTVEPENTTERVVELLAESARRRAAISIILHSDEYETSNIDILLKLWEVFVKKPRVDTWRLPADHTYTKLYAKCLVVDRLDALVTSANFKFHGLESNLEPGLRVRDPQAAAIAERFDHLFASGFMSLWPESSEPSCIGLSGTLLP